MEINDIKIGNMETFRKDFEDRIQEENKEYPPFFNEDNGMVVWHWREDIVDAIYIPPQNTEAEMIGLLLRATELLKRKKINKGAYT